MTKTYNVPLPPAVQQRIRNGEKIPHAVKRRIAQAVKKEIVRRILDQLTSQLRSGIASCITVRL